MRSTTFAACVAMMLSIGAAAAQDARPATDPPPPRGDGTPAADARSPGATATEAITDPARVPPGTGPGGTGVPGAGGPATPSGRPR